MHKLVKISGIVKRQDWTRLNSYAAHSVFWARRKQDGVQIMSWDHRTLFPRKSPFIFNHWQCIIKYCTCLECGQYGHICRSFVYKTFEALFLTSKCTKRGFLLTQTVAPHRGFCKAAHRRYRITTTRWWKNKVDWALESILFHRGPSMYGITYQLIVYRLVVLKCSRTK